MKIRYYLMSVALTALCSVGFTSCSDDDEPAGGNTEESTLTLPDEVTRVKIGEENRVALPIIDGAGTYHAYSLNPAVVDVVEGADGALYLEGFKNGATSVVVSDANNTYKRMAVSVYTTEVMTLNKTELDFNVTMGQSATNTECAVTLGNGDYTATSDNERVRATVDPETGEITLVASAGKSEYTAIVTIKDASDLVGTIKVHVVPSFDGFTESEIEDILALDEETLYGSCKDPSDGTYPYYWSLRSNGYGEWISGVADGVRTIGWWFIYNGRYDYGGLKVEIPETAAVGQEVAGKLTYQYSYIAWYAPYTYEGTAKILEDNDQRTVAIFWNVDMENERINRAYFVQYK